MTFTSTLVTFISLTIVALAASAGADDAVSALAALIEGKLSSQGSGARLECSLNDVCKTVRVNYGGPGDPPYSITPVSRGDCDCPSGTRCGGRPKWTKFSESFIPSDFIKIVHFTMDEYCVPIDDSPSCSVRETAGICSTQLISNDYHLTLMNTPGCICPSDQTCDKPVIFKENTYAKFTSYGCSTKSPTLAPTTAAPTPRPSTRNCGTGEACKDPNGDYLCSCIHPYRCNTVFKPQYSSSCQLTL